MLVLVLCMLLVFTGAVAVDVAYVVHMAVALVVASDAACLADVWCFCCCLCCVCRC